MLTYEKLASAVFRSQIVLAAGHLLNGASLTGLLSVAQAEGVSVRFNVLPRTEENGPLPGMTVSLVYPDGDSLVSEAATAPGVCIQNLMAQLLEREQCHT